MRALHRLIFMIALVGGAAVAPAQQTPYAGTIAIPGTLQAENYDRGGNGVAWSDTTAGNVFGVYRSDDMDVGAIPGTTAEYHVGNLAPGEWAEYSVNVATSGTYNVTLRWASDYTSATNPSTFKLYQNGVLLTTQPVEKTSLTAGDWHRYLTKTFAVSLSAGASILKVEFATGYWNFDWLSFQLPACAAPAITALPAQVTVDTPGITWTYNPAVNGAVTYQWFKNGTAFSTQSTIKTLSVPQIEQGKDLGAYTLQAWSSCGAVSTSNAMNIVRVRCSASPGQSTENLNRALRQPPLPDYCYWQEDLHYNFITNGTDTQGSYNRPVIAAAIAYVKGDTTYDSWWDSYLKGELGKSGGAANWVYGGNEIGSFTYQHFNTISVMAVALHAQRTGATARRALALEWLRNTFSLNALAAAPASMLTMHSQGQYRSGTAYSGPYIAMAGERSNYVNWDGSDRSILFSEAVGFLQNGKGETDSVGNTRRYIVASSPAATSTAPGPYGLTTTQQGALRTIVNNGVLPSGFVGNYVSTTLRTKMPYHFVGWQSPEVVRLTLMERNNHTWTAPTFGAVFFTNPRAANGREVHLLWPWSGLWANENYKNGVTYGTATLNLTSGYVEAEQPGSTFHPYMKFRIDGLPAASSRSYWVTLSPGAAPAIR